MLMETPHKGGTMRTTRILMACVGIPVVLSSQQRAERIERPEVRTAATVERTAPPDLATITIQLFGQGATPREAGRRLAATTDSVRRALATLGIPRDSVVNRNRYYWWSGKIETVALPVRYVQRHTATALFSEAVRDTAYRAHDALEIRVRDLSRLGAILDTLMNRGITNISGVQFTATNTAAAEQAALRQATIRARRQAEVIADAGGMTLGTVLSLSTQPDDYDYNAIQLRSTVSGADAGGGVSGSVVVQPAIPISVTVYGRWALVKKQ